MQRSQAQIEASRINGSRSRGPVTAAGKARSAANSLKHGLHSSVLVLNNESVEEFEALLAQYLEIYRPADPRQLALVHEMVNATWRLNRILALETAGIDLEVDRRRHAELEDIPSADEATRTHMAVSALIDNSRVLAWYSRQEGRLRRIIRDAEAKLEKCKNEPGTEDGKLR